MPKSATDLMQEIVFSAVLDSIVALRTSAKGLPNALWRDVGAIHLNTTLADLPPEVQAAIGESARAAFGKLRQEGYTVAGGPPEPDRRGPPRPRPSGPRTPPTVETRRSRPMRPGPNGGPGSGPKR